MANEKCYHMTQKLKDVIKDGQLKILVGENIYLSFDETEEIQKKILKEI